MSVKAYEFTVNLRLGVKKNKTLSCLLFIIIIISIIIFFFYSLRVF